jgi:hypothetical protein
MSNAVTPAADAAVPALDLNQFRQGIANYKATRPTSSADLAYAKMDKHGVWVAGREGKELAPNSMWVVDIRTFGHGKIAWHNSQVEWKTLVPIAQPITATPPPGLQAKNGVQDLVAFRMACVEGDDEGMQVEFNSNSYGGNAAVSDLVDAVAERIDMEDNENAVFPVITLSNKSYMHSNKEYGKIYNPIFVIEDWMTLEEVASGTYDAEAAQEPVEEAAPEPEPEPAPEPVAAAAPKPRRRKRAA